MPLCVSEMDTNKNNVSVHRGKGNGRNVVCLLSCTEMVVGKIKVTLKTAFRRMRLSFLILQCSPPRTKGPKPVEELEKLVIKRTSLEESTSSYLFLFLVLFFSHFLHIKIKPSKHINNLSTFPSVLSTHFSLLFTLTLSNPITVTHQASLSMGFFQARILEWVAIPFSKGSSQPRDHPGCPALKADSYDLPTRKAYTLPITLLGNSQFQYVVA